jgi:hypothetical protein
VPDLVAMKDGVLAARHENEIGTVFADSPDTAAEARGSA